VVILVAAGLAAVLWRTAAPAEPLRLDGAGETPGEPLAP